MLLHQKIKAAPSKTPELYPTLAHPLFLSVQFLLYHPLTRPLPSTSPVSTFVLMLLPTRYAFPLPCHLLFPCLYLKTQGRSYFILDACFSFSGKCSFLSLTSFDKSTTHTHLFSKLHRVSWNHDRLGFCLEGMVENQLGNVSWDEIV